MDKEVEGGELPKECQTAHCTGVKTPLNERHKKKNVPSVPHGVPIRVPGDGYDCLGITVIRSR